MKFLSIALAICSTSFLVQFVSGHIIAYSLTASYFDGAPDGVPKRILGFNNQFPAPTLRANKGDVLRITVTNLIQPGETTTIHWHGIEQYLTPWQDGPRMLTQCDIPYNTSFTYEFRTLQSGTYWYHSHHTGQYVDGLWGVLIIDNAPGEVHKYDGEFALTLSDWYHTPAPQITEWYEHLEVSRGGLPFPDISLLNGMGYYPCEYANRSNRSCNPSFATRHMMLEVERGKTYRFRLINPSASVMHRFSIDGHKLEAIETDGVDTIKVAGDLLPVSTGSRWSVLVKMDGPLDVDQYWIRSTGFFAPKLDRPNINPFPEVFMNNPAVLAVLKYVNSTSKAGSKVRPYGVYSEEAVQGRPETRDPQLLQSMLRNGGRVQQETEEPVIDGFAYYNHEPLRYPLASPPYPTTSSVTTPVSINQNNCHPISGERAPSFVNQTIIISISDMDHPNRTEMLGFYNMTYSTASLDKPALVKLIRGEPLPDSLVPVVIDGFGHDYVVELIINDYGDWGHPLHLHGHTFWMMGSGGVNTGPFNETTDRPRLTSGVRRETIPIGRSGWVVLRFRADNPGIWLFHCHVNFHFESAMGLVFVEGEETARELYKNVPQNQMDLCRLNGIELEEKEISDGPPGDSGAGNIGGTIIATLIIAMAGYRI